MEKVLIIGADGFIGSKLCEHLSSRCSVVAFVYEKSFMAYDSLASNVTVVPYNFETILIKDYSEVLANVDVMYHMAWAGVTGPLKNEEEMQVQNISFGIKVMELANKYGIHKVLVPGSASEFALGDGIIDGKSDSAPSDMYSACKVATRFVCQTYAKQHHIDLVWTFITSIYGPGRNDNNLLTYVIKSLLNEEKPQTTKLEQQWDYLYIDDLLRALELLGEKGFGGKNYPIGSGDNRPMYEYVQIIKDSINSSLPVGVGDLPYKSSKIDNQIMDISELQKDTGFIPSVSFEEGINRTIDYFREQN